MGNISLLEIEIIEMLNRVIEEKDSYTYGHSKRVAMYSSRIAAALGLSEEDQNNIYKAGLLHDIGKIITPEDVLLNPNRLKKHQNSVMQQHAKDGAKMVSSISAFKLLAPTIQHHHEYYNGKGYPDRLCGEAIPLHARIMCIADSFDAMTTSRMNGSHNSVEHAIFEIERMSGEAFDPSIVPVALSVFRDFLNSHLAETISLVKVSEEMRFASFTKDNITDLYNAEYLNFFLHNNKEKHQFRCCYFIQTHHMGDYNERFGWDSGNLVLKDIALRIKVLFHSPFVFRVFGDDFVVLIPLHVEIDFNETIHRLHYGFTGIEVSLNHFDLEVLDIKRWEDLERNLVHIGKKSPLKLSPPSVEVVEVYPDENYFQAPSLEHVSLEVKSKNTKVDYYPEDVAEMREIIDDIDYLVVELFGNGKVAYADPELLERLIARYAKYSFILKNYFEHNMLNEKFFELSCVLRSFIEPDISFDTSLVGEFMECMTSSLVLFQLQVVEEKSLDANFFDASLINDIDTIINTISHKETQSTYEELVEFF